MRYIGLDIGGTKCAVAAGEVEERPSILQRREYATAAYPYRQMIDRLCRDIAEFDPRGEAAAVGISCGGPLDSRAGVLRKVPNLPEDWHGRTICADVAGRTGKPVYLANDANACALAEWRFGAGRGAKNMIFLTFGTGLGAGLILNGKLYEGACGNAGEVGHIRLAEDGPIGFYKAGSAEGFCSGGGIARLALSMAAHGGAEAAELLADTVDAKRVAQLARAGNGFCRAVLAESGARLGQTLAILIDLINPDVVVIGGVFMRCGDLLIGHARKVLEREALADSVAACRIVPAGLEENIGDCAALAVACYGGEDENEK